MKRLLLSIFLLSSIQVLYGQHKTYGVGEEGLLDKRGGLGSLVIIPFRDKMYMSDADDPIGRETGLNPGELMTKFRNSLLESLEKEMSKDWNITLINQEAELEEGFGLDFVQNSVAYRYVAVPGDVLQANDTTIEKKDLKKQKAAKKEHNGIQEGQIVTRSNPGEMYMQMYMANDTLLDYLNHNTGSDYYLFLNEFDILHFISDPDKIASGGLKYQLKIHFSCVDKEGKVLVSGAATTLVDARTNNVYEIIHQGIPVLTKKLSKMIRKYRNDIKD
jgi:hypothetical protein